MRAFRFYTVDYADSRRAFKKHCAKGKEIYTPQDDPQAYPNAVEAQWGIDDILITEQDIVVPPGTFNEFASCPRDWCVNTYPIGLNRWEFRYGFGCTKFSLALQRKIPYYRLKVHATSFVEDCTWCNEGKLYVAANQCKNCLCHWHQDTVMRHELHMLGMDEPHVHQRMIGHLHEFRPDNSATVVSDSGGHLTLGLMKGQQLLSMKDAARDLTKPKGFG